LSVTSYHSDTTLEHIVEQVKHKILVCYLYGEILYIGLPEKVFFFTKSLVFPINS